MEGKTSYGRAAPREEPFWQRYHLRQRSYRWRRKTQGNGVDIGLQNADAQRAGKIPVSRERRVGGILDKVAQEAGAGTDGRGGGADIHRVEGAFGGVRGVIAVIANIGCAELLNQGWLVVERNFFGGDGLVSG